MPREETASDLSSEVTSTLVDLDVAGGNLCGRPEHRREFTGNATRHASRVTYIAVHGLGDVSRHCNAYVVLRQHDTVSTACCPLRSVDRSLHTEETKGKRMIEYLSSR